MSPNFGTCDKCGAKATSIARDAILKPNGKWACAIEFKRGCAAHPVESLDKDEAGNVLPKQEMVNVYTEPKK